MFVKQNDTFHFYADSAASKYFAEVGKYQVYLTKDEEIKLTTDYKATRNELHSYVVSKPQCRQWFFTTYHNLRLDGRSVAKLSADFNPREKGVSSIIEDKMERWLKDRRRNEQITLLKLNLSDWCYSEMIKLMTPTKKLDDMQAELRRIEDILLRSMLMAAQEIAKNNTTRLLSVDEADAAQEVNLYFLDAIRRYNPD